MKWNHLRILHPDNSPPMRVYDANGLEYHSVFQIDLDKNQLIVPMTKEDIEKEFGSRPINFITKKIIEVPGPIMLVPIK